MIDPKSPHRPNACPVTNASTTGANASTVRPAPTKQPDPHTPPSSTKKPGPADSGGDGSELTKPATERQVDHAVKESFPASDPTSTQLEHPGAGDAPPDLRHRLPPVTDAEREAVDTARDGV